MHANEIFGLPFKLKELANWLKAYRFDNGKEWFRSFVGRRDALGSKCLTEHRFDSEK